MVVPHINARFRRETAQHRAHFQPAAEIPFPAQSDPFPASDGNNETSAKRAARVTNRPVALPARLEIGGCKPQENSLALNQGGELRSSTLRTRQWAALTSELRSLLRVIWDATDYGWSNLDCHTLQKTPTPPLQFASLDESYSRPPAQNASHDHHLRASIDHAGFSFGAVEQSTTRLPMEHGGWSG